MPLFAQSLSWAHGFRTICHAALRSAFALVVGERCAICGAPLVGEVLCADCWLGIPYTQLRGHRGNLLETLFWDDERVERVNAWAWYKPEFPFAQVVHAFKYHGHRRLAVQCGMVMAYDLEGTDFFDSTDLLIPVPLSRQRLRQRGYNQSALLAEGVHRVTGIPLCTTAVRRVVDNPSQTTLDPSQRRANVSGIFSVVDASALTGRRIIVIDDVLTVGATLQSLVHTLRSVPNLRIRLLTLCAAGRYHLGRLRETDLNLPDCTADYNPNALRRYRPL